MSRKNSEQYLAVLPNPFTIDKYLKSKAAYLLSVVGNKNCKGTNLQSLILNAVVTHLHTTMVIGDGIHYLNMQAKYPNRSGESSKETRAKGLQDLCEGYWEEILPDVLNATRHILFIRKVPAPEIDQLLQNLHEELHYDDTDQVPADVKDKANWLLDHKVGLLNDFLAKQKINISFERYNTFVSDLYRTHKKALEATASSIKSVADRIRVEANDYVDAHYPKYNQHADQGHTDWRHERNRLVELEKKFFLEETFAFVVTAIDKNISYLFYPGNLKILDVVAKEFCNATSKGKVRESELNKECLKQWKEEQKEIHAVSCIKLKLEKFRSEEAYKLKWNGKLKSLDFLPLIRVVPSLTKDQSSTSDSLGSSDDSNGSDNTAKTDTHSEQSKAQGIVRKTSGSISLPIPQTRIKTSVDTTTGQSKSWPPNRDAGFFKPQNQIPANSAVVENATLVTSRSKPTETQTSNVSGVNEINITQVAEMAGRFCASYGQFAPPEDPALSKQWATFFWNLATVNSNSDSTKPDSSKNAGSQSLQSTSTTHVRKTRSSSPPKVRQDEKTEAATSNNVNKPGSTLQ